MQYDQREKNQKGRILSKVQATNFHVLLVKAKGVTALRSINQNLPINICNLFQVLLRYKLSANSLLRRLIGLDKRGKTCLWQAKSIGECLKHFLKHLRIYLYCLLNCICESVFPNKLWFSWRQTLGKMWFLHPKCLAKFLDTVKILNNIWWIRKWCQYFIYIYIFYFGIYIYIFIYI